MSLKQLILEPALRARELKQLALLCGFRVSGTKDVVKQDLVHGLSDYKPIPSNARLLSIDLGLRNLAYSLLSLNPLPSRTLKHPKEHNRAHEPTGNSPHAWQRPTLEAWEQLALVGENAVSLRTANIEMPSWSTRAEFGPGTLGPITVSLLRERLLALKPTHILIERQRFRSGGGPAVFEWTVRVNSLESMLYGILSWLKASGEWDGHVVPMEPRRIANFMLDSPEDDDSADHKDPLRSRRPAKELSLKKSTDVKKLKMDLLEGILQNGELIDVADGRPGDMVSSFLDRSRRRVRKAKAADHISDIPGQAPRDRRLEPEKWDDLADSLLQAIAWLKWEANRYKLVDGGSKALL